MIKTGDVGFLKQTRFKASERAAGVRHVILAGETDITTSRAIEVEEPKGVSGDISETGTGTRLDQRLEGALSFQVVEDARIPQSPEHVEMAVNRVEQGRDTCLLCGQYFHN